MTAENYFFKSAARAVCAAAHLTMFLPPRRRRCLRSRRRRDYQVTRRANAPLVRGERATKWRGDSANRQPGGQPSPGGRWHLRSRRMRANPVIFLFVRRFSGGHTGPPLRSFNKIHRILQKNLRQFCFAENSFLNRQNRT